MHYGFVGVVIAYVIFVAVSLATATPTEESIEYHSRPFWEGAD